MVRSIMILLMAALAAMLPREARADADAAIIHPFVASTSQIFCSQCHGAGIGRSFAVDKRTCDQYCKTCHGKMEGHHATDVKPGDRMKPGALRLKGDGSMACFTCHDATMPRFAAQSYRSRAPLVLLFDWNRKHRTFFLTVRNNKGQLCMICH